MKMTLGQLYSNQHMCTRPRRILPFQCGNRSAVRSRWGMGGKQGVLRGRDREKLLSVYCWLTSQNCRGILLEESSSTSFWWEQGNKGTQASLWTGRQAAAHEPAKLLTLHHGHRSRVIAASLGKTMLAQCVCVHTGSWQRAIKAL